MTEIYLTNTLTKRKEKFVPIDPANVRMYVCGPTVYDHAHLGNGKTPVSFDILYRLLRYVYGAEHVTYVSNITDVEDKILNKHKQTGLPIAQITAETTKWYLDDMKKLGNLEPNFRPKATEYISEMIKLVEKLLANGHAYQSAGHVLFDVESMQNYGFLSGKPMKEMLAGVRIDVADYKKNPADFVLWKPSDISEPGWDSPWGYGRPGWHLECSAMSSKLLGNDFDIHGGGSDLIFPHHENECAQSLCAFPHSAFAKYWVHAGMVMVDGVKMSKSLGNFYILDDILAKVPAEAFRLLCLLTHYHQPFNFTFEALQNAKLIMDKFYNALLQNVDVAVEDVAPSALIIDALADDLNTPLAVAVLHEDVANLNKTTLAEDKQKYKAQLLADASMLGLLQNDPQIWFKGASSDDDALIEQKIAARNEAKKNKDWATADAIRNELKEKGILLEDSPNGTTWKRA